MKLSGTYDQIYNKWFSIYESKRGSRSFFIALGVFLCIASLLIFFVWLLRRQIAKATRLLSDSKREVGIAIDAGKISAWTYIIKDQTITALHGQLVGGPHNPIERIYEMIHPDDVEAVRSTFQDLSMGVKQAMEIAFRIREHEDTPYLYLETKMVRVEATKDHPCRIVGTLKDVTEDVRMRTKLEDYRIKSQFIIKTNDIVLMQYDVASGSIIELNEDETQEQLTCTTETYMEHVHPEDKNAVISFMTEINQGKNPVIYTEYRMKSGDETYNWYTVNAVAYKYDRHNNITSYIGLRRNNTKWKNITSDLIELKEKADASNRFKSAFVANMSHEIRTPLNAIVGFSEMIIETEDLNEKVEYIEIVRTNNTLLLQLINDVLDLSKIEAGYMNLNYSTFDFSSFFGELVMTFKRKESETVKFLYTPSDLDVKIHSDKYRLSQVITNLIHNAFKFTPSGSVRLSCAYENEGVRISVTDTGVGISEENIDRIFDRFEKMNHFAQGAGLGLSICKGILDALHGQIGVESQLGIGSTFWIWFANKAPLEVPHTETETGGDLYS